MSVLPMRWWHLDTVSELEQQLFPDDAWSMEQFWQELALDTRHYVVAVGPHGVEGYAGAFVLPPDSDVQTIAVRQDRQGLGIAAGLLGALLGAARSAGCTHMMLEVRADNSRAIALYERFGFEVISRRRSYYPDGEDALILRAGIGTMSGPAATS